MDFAFTEEQDMLRTSVRQLMSERYPIDRVAAIADGDGFDRAEWAAVAELGWSGISVPEEQGGAGLSFLEEVVVAEELARALYPGPFFSTVVLGLGALRQAGYPDYTPALVSGQRIATVAWAGEDGHFEIDPAPKVQWDEQNDLISGTRLFVTDVALADLLIVVGGFEQGTGIWIADLDSPGVHRREIPTVDGTRRMGEVALENAHARILAHGPGTAFQPLRDRALAALAVEAVGVASAALELALDHARNRQQFGRAIGSFQAVSHPLAQAYLEVETARSLAYWAAWAVSEGDPEASRAAAAAKARAADAAVATCERAIQVHGRTGFTWEHPLHRFYKRALGIAAFMGWAGELRARVATELLDEPQ